VIPPGRRHRKNRLKMGEAMNRIARAGSLALVVLSACEFEEYEFFHDNDSSEGASPRSLAFDGIDDIVDFGDFTGLNGVSAYTIQVWVRFIGLGQWQTVFCKRQSDSDRATVLQAYDAGGRLGVSVNDGYRYTTSPAVTTGVWYHAVVVYDGTVAEPNRIRLYLNGNPQTMTIYGTGDAPATTPASATRFVAGANYNALTPVTPNSADFPMAGNVDELAVWNNALSAAEVAALYNAGKPLPVTANSGAYTSSANVIGYWRFNDGTGTTATATVGAFHGNLVGGVTWSTMVP
jgi:hypothetical protein